MTNEDYLGITALALADLAELLANSIDVKDVRPIIIDHLTTATTKWAGDAGQAKEEFVANVKDSINQVENWRANYPDTDLYQLNILQNPLEPKLSKN